MNVCLKKIVIHCGAWAENVRSSLFEGCVASWIFSYPFFFFNVLSNGQLLILMYKLQLTTPAVNSANQTPQLYRQTPAGVWSRWIWGCMGVCAVFSAGCTIAPRGSLVSIQVEFYEYLVSRWDPDHPPRTHQYAQRGCPLPSSVNPRTPHKCSDQSQVDTQMLAHTWDQTLQSLTVWYGLIPHFITSIKVLLLSSPLCSFATCNFLTLLHPFSTLFLTYATSCVHKHTHTHAGL